MKKIVYIPLDERPCNYLFPQMMAAGCSEIKLAVPAIGLLGNKKEKADTEAVWDFLKTELEGADAAVLSVEMLAYGGLLPSRLHHQPENWKEEVIERLRQIRKMYPQTRLFLFQLIMRTPRYNSSDEEPDYYETYGERIFKRAYYSDKREREGLSGAELEAYEMICQEIPEEYICDYEERRCYNLDLNKKIVDLVAEGIVDDLCIPQDDSCEFGYTARDQRQVHSMIREKRLQRRVLMYPGADEAGCSLVARATAVLNQWKLQIYPFFSSELGPQIIPLYEDRIMMESVKSHIMACGCRVAASPEAADFILAVNSPGKKMEEAFHQKDKDVTYQSFRNLNWFVDEIRYHMENGKSVLLADCAFSNGGDLELLELLDQERLLDRLISYKGWNTCCNTLGTSIAQGVLAYKAKANCEVLTRNLLYHILDDGIYQSQIRKEVTDSFPGSGLTYFDLKDEEKAVGEKTAGLIMQYFSERICHTFSGTEIETITVTHPWNRMFEIQLHLKLRSP